MTWAAGVLAVPASLSNWDLASVLLGLIAKTRRRQYSRRSRSVMDIPKYIHPCSDNGSTRTTSANSAAARTKSPDLAAAIPALKVSSFDKRFSRLQ
jgi:hypothetical protein